MTLVTKMSLIIVSIVITLVCLEIGARVFADRTHVNHFYLEISKEYPKLNQLLKDWNVLRMQYHDYYIFSPHPASSRTVNFTDYFGARSTPGSAGWESAQEIIWAFGGSTMQNLESDDELSIANQIAVWLRRSYDIQARVVNFGVAGFQSSLESIKFQDLLRRVPLDERPQSVVFYDGFNDAIAGYQFGPARMQKDLSLKLRDVVEGRYEPLLLFTTSKLVGRHSVLWREFIGKGIENRLYKIDKVWDSDHLDKSVSSYVLNVRMTRAICEQLDIHCIFILQPLVLTKSKPTEMEKAVIEETFRRDPLSLEFVKSFYAEVGVRLRDEPAFHNLSDVLDDSDESDFYDLCHTSPKTGIKLGKAIADELVRSRQNVVKSGRNR